ncbi:MAG: CoA transferase [Candidatus Berkiella sp.]
MKEEIKKLFSIPRNGPLNGYLVLEIGNLISGPMASQELARKGALVIKLENKGRGDTARGILSQAVFSSCNASKASIALDKTNAEDDKIYLELLALADVVIDNRSPDAKMRDSVLQGFLKSQKNHPVIFCSIVGYDSDAYQDRSALDVAVQAETGMAMVNAPNQSFPLKVGFVVIDISTAIQAASTIKDHLLALARGLQLPPQANNLIFIEQSMAKTAAMLLTGQYLNAYTQQKEPIRDANKDLFVAPFSFYKTKDGMVSIAIIGDQLFTTFCKKVLGAAALADKYPTNQSRLESPDFDKDLGQILITKESYEWINLCKPFGIVCTKVNSVLEMLKEPFAKEMLTTTQSGIPIIADTSVSSAFSALSLTDAPSLDEHRKHISAMLRYSSKIQPSGISRFTQIYELFLQHYPFSPPAMLYAYHKSKQEMQDNEEERAWHQSSLQRQQSSGINAPDPWQYSPSNIGKMKAKL